MLKIKAPKIKSIKMPKVKVKSICSPKMPRVFSKKRT